MADYNSIYTGAQIDSAVRISLALGFEESTDFPGCFYRTVNGVVEWLNPPMQLGVEYRTTERYLDKPVYRKLVDCGSGPAASSTKDVLWGDSTGSDIVEWGGDVASTALPYTNMLNENDYLHVSVGVRAISAKAGSVRGFDSYNYKVWVKYVKSTD